MQRKKVQRFHGLVGRPPVYQDDTGRRAADAARKRGKRV